LLTAIFVSLQNTLKFAILSEALLLREGHAPPALQARERAWRAC
jgi:hypothetical protein